MNAMSTINALILTIPFSIVSSLNFEYWDALKTNIIDCSDMDYDYTEVNLITPLYVCVSSSILSLIFAMMYYFLRPKEHFADWWRYRGKWSVAMTLLLTVIAVVVILTIFATLMGWYVSSSDGICESWEKNIGRYRAAYSFIGLSFGLMFIVLF